MKTSEKAPLSVIIPCYRCEATLQRALESVATQTWPPAEVIVVSDGNPTHILALIGEIIKNSSLVVHLLHLPENLGPGEARNRGWEKATQVFVGFLDADDVWHPEKVERQVGWMLRHPQVSFTSHVYACTPPPISLPLETFPEPKPFSSLSLLWYNPIATPTVVLKRELPFRFPKKRTSEDYALWLRLALSGYTPYFFTEVLAWGFKHPWGQAGLSARLWEMELGELETYFSLAREGKIPWSIFPVLAVWSLAKFGRRICLSKIRRWLGSPSLL